MNRNINKVFQEYLSAHLEEDAIDFEPLLAQHPQFRDSLIKKIDSYRLAMGQAVPHKKSAVGETLGGCRLEKSIGEGGMSTVYLATQLSLNRKVAVKILYINPSSKSYSIDRFKREGQTIAKLDHRSIVPVYDVGEEAGLHYIVMKYVEGISLEEIIHVYEKRGKQPDLEMIDQIRKSHGLEVTCLSEKYKNYTEFICSSVAKIGDAVSYAHQNHVIHRDIKPSNILIKNDGEPVLVDFGISKDISDLRITQTGEYLGTPVYSSPEQLFGNTSDVGETSDIYSLGITLYELTVGHLPFKDDSLAKVIEHLKNKIPFDPKIFNPQLPRDLSTIILKATHVEPKKRYQSTKIFKNDLQAFLSFRPISAKPPSRISKIALYIRLHKRKIIPATLALVLALGLLSLLVVRETMINKRVGELYLQGKEFGSWGDHQQVIATMNKILALRPNETKAMQLIALSQYSSDVDISDILKYLDDRLAEYPDDVHLLQAKALGFGELKKPEEAVVIWKQILHQRDNAAPSPVNSACENLGIYYSDLKKDIPQLKRTMDICLPMFPDDPAINFLNFFYCKEIGNVDCQIKHLAVAAKASNDARYHIILGTILLDQGQYKEARENLEKALSLASSETAQKYAYLLLAVACRKLNDQECTLKASQKSRELHGDDLDFQNSLKEFEKGLKNQ